MLDVRCCDCQCLKLGNKRKNYYYIQKEMHMFRNLKNSSELTGSEPSTSKPSVNNSSFQASESEVSKDGARIQMDTSTVKLSLQGKSSRSIENSDILDSDCADFSASNSEVENDNIEFVRSDSEENLGLSKLLLQNVRA